MFGLSDTAWRFLDIFHKHEVSALENVKNHKLLSLLISSFPFISLLTKTLKFSQSNTLLNLQSCPNLQTFWRKKYLHGLGCLLEQFSFLQVLSWQTPPECWNLQLKLYLQNPISWKWHFTLILKIISEVIDFFSSFHPTK